MTDIQALKKAIGHYRAEENDDGYKAVQRLSDDALQLLWLAFRHQDTIAHIIDQLYKERFTEVTIARGTPVLILRSTEYHPTDWITVNEAASLLKMNRETFRYYIKKDKKEGKPNPFQLTYGRGRRYMAQWSDILQWAQKKGLAPSEGGS